MLKKKTKTQKVTSQTKVLPQRPLISPWFYDEDDNKQNELPEVQGEFVANKIQKNIVASNSEIDDAVSIDNQYEELLNSLKRKDGEQILPGISQEIPNEDFEHPNVENIFATEQKSMEVKPPTFAELGESVSDEPSLIKNIAPEPIRPSAASIEQELTNAELERSRIIEPTFVHKNKGQLPQSDSIIIGRKDEFSDYVIDDNPKVSASHLRLFKEDGNWFVTDQNSSNGTRLNGVKLQPEMPKEIKFGDVISFVGETITFEESN